jgi:hypothetical protein
MKKVVRSRKCDYSVKYFRSSRTKNYVTCHVCEFFRVLKKNKKKVDLVHKEQGDHIMERNDTQFDKRVTVHNVTEMSLV